MGKDTISNAEDPPRTFCDVSQLLWFTFKAGDELMGEEWGSQSLGMSDLADCPLGPYAHLGNTSQTKTEGVPLQCPVTDRDIILPFLLNIPNEIYAHEHVCFSGCKRA